MDKTYIIKIISLLSIISILLLYSPCSIAATDEAGVFSVDTLYNAYGKELSELAREGLRKLGYTITAYNDCVSTVSPIVDYMSGTGKNYALYMNGHGDSTVFTTVKQNAESSNLITTTNNTITGYWHFVFVSSCNSAETDAFATAFKTIGYSNRAFMGWYKEIAVGYNKMWSEEFWAHVGENTLRQVALDATGVSNVARYYSN